MIVLIVAGCTANKPEQNDPEPSPTPNNNNNGNSGNVEKPDDGKTEVVVNEELKMNIEISTIQKEASDGKENEGKETVDVKQAKISFNRLPSTLEELQAIDRTGADGKFITMAMLICAFKTWTPDNPDTCDLMMRELMNSPTVENCYNEYSRSFVKERMLQNDKWEYIADAYFDGAEDINAYYPDEPLTITLREYPYLPETSTIYGTKLLIDKVVIEFQGADTERSISVYQDPTNSKWYIWSDSYKSMLADIRFPAK